MLQTSVGVFDDSETLSRSLDGPDELLLATTALVRRHERVRQHRAHRVSQDWTICVGSADPSPPFTRRRLRGGVFRVSSLQITSCERGSRPTLLGTSDETNTKSVLFGSTGTCMGSDTKTTNERLESVFSKIVSEYQIRTPLCT